MLVTFILCWLHLFVVVQFGFVCMSGCMNVTHTKWVHKLDFPVADWPLADFPAIKYPYHDNLKFNQAEEQRSLKQVQTKTYALCTLLNNVIWQIN